jgi:asparagine synthase (glutamine-hydrolysing)
MCSIFGYITKQPKDITIFQRCLQHRGPDGHGVYEDLPQRLTLGHSRLSIIDLSAVSDQPMLDEDENMILVFNGEIYNYQEIKNDLVADGFTFKTHSDTEVLLKAFKKYGKHCLSRLRGMFAFALYDKQRRKLFLARDRYGIKPLFYSFYDNQFSFASEVTPLVEAGLAPRHISRKGLNDYFTFGSVQQPDTIYSHIFALMPATYMELDVETLKYTTERYYDYMQEALRLPYASLSYTEAVQLVRQKLEEATRYHLVADVEVGAFLSGGVDSTAVVALMSKYTSKAIKTFSVGFAGRTEVEDETQIARRSAQLLGCDHTDVILESAAVPDMFGKYVRALDQPSTDGFNTFIVSQAAAKSVKVVLSGLGGDEIFAGYPHFERILAGAPRQPNIFEKLGQQAHKLRPNRFTAELSYYGKDPFVATLDERRVKSRDLLGGLLSRPPYAEKNPGGKNLSILQQVSHAELDRYLLNTLLRDADVMSMAHSLECRPVLLDHVLVETALALPDDYKIRDGRKKAIFIDAVKDIIPAEVYQRRKSGFEMPIATWMNDVLADYSQASLTSDIARQLFDAKYLANQRTRVQGRSLKRDFWQTLVLLQWLNHTRATLA